MKRITPARRLLRRALLWQVVACGILIAITWRVVGGAPGFTLMLWEYCDPLLPAWWAIDPWAPRIAYPQDIVKLQGPEARGRALRAAIDSFYADLPETQRALIDWLWAVPICPYCVPSIDVSPILRHYVPLTTTFAEAERILNAAGLIVRFRNSTQLDDRLALDPLKILPAEVLTPEESLPRIYLQLEQVTHNPYGYMRLYVDLFSQSAHQYLASDPIGKVVANLRKQIGPPSPRVSFPFDASKSTTSIDEMFRVDSARAFSFELTFHPRRPAEIAAIRKLIGNGSRYSDGHYADPGVVVPVHLMISAETGVVAYEGDVDVQGLDSASFGEDNRAIIRLGLAPGVYWLHAHTAKDVPELTNVWTELSIGFRVK